MKLAKFNHFLQNKIFFTWLLALCVAVILLSPLPYWFSGIGQTATELSTEITRHADGALQSSPKAQARHSLMLPMSLERMVIYPVLLLAFQLSGGAAALRRRLERLTHRLLPATTTRRRISAADILLVFLFIILFDMALFSLYLPFNFYRSFIVGHQFGLSTHTPATWLGDWSKSVLITLTTDGLLWTSFYALLRLMPKRWPLPAGALLLTFSLTFTLLTPIVITPLFYKVNPLADAELRQRIITLTEQAGMRVNDVYIIEASAKTTAVNAYFTGFGQARRIVLYDTLLTGYTPDQIEVVLAHEMGHWYYRHLLWSILGLGAAAWLGLFGLQWLLQQSWQQLGLHSPADVAGLPYILAVIAIISTLSLPVQNGISRMAERQADRFALDTSRNPTAFIALFEQFAVQNLSLVDTARWEKFIFYTHPATAERIENAQAWANQHPTKK